MRRLILIVICFAFLVNCSRKENPFAPKTGTSSTAQYSINYEVGNFYLDQNGGKYYASMMLDFSFTGSNLVIVNSTVDAGWDASGLEGVSFFSSPSESMGNIHVSENSVELPSGSIISGLYHNDEIVLTAAREESYSENKYSYNVPQLVLRNTISPSAELYIDRYYRIWVQDMYGRDIIRDVTVQLCGVSLSLTNIYYSSALPGMGDFQPENKIGQGRVVSHEGNVYTIQVLFTGWELARMYQYGQGQPWKIKRIKGFDLVKTTIDIIPASDQQITVRYTGKTK